MAAGSLWLVCLNHFFRVFRTSRCGCPILRSGANFCSASEYDFREKQNFSPTDDEIRRLDSRRFGNTNTTMGNYEIPDPGNMDLYEYIKHLESSTTHTRGVILKTWSRITRNSRNGSISNGFKTRSAHCLGLTTSLLNERLKFLAHIGIRGRDALIIAVEFPSVLTWDSPNFKMMLHVLNDLKCDIVRLLCRNPYVFGLDYTRTRQNLQKLTSCGIPKEALGKVVTHHPIILSFPFSHDSIETVQLILNSHATLQPYGSNNEKSLAMEEAIVNLLLQPMEKYQQQVNLQENFKQVVTFLQEMQVSPLVIASKNPMIFATNANTLRSAVEFFSNKPLLFELDVIQELLTLRSEVFVNFDKAIMNSRIRLIYNIVQSPTVLYNLLQSSFTFEKSDTKIEEIIQWLRDYGIQDKKIAYLLTLKNFFSLDKRDFVERADYLLTVKGVTLGDIQENPACLLKPLSHLKERIGFLNAENSVGLKNKDLSQVMMSKNKEFAVEVCGSSLEKFIQFLEAREKKGK